MKINLRSPNVISFGIIMLILLFALSIAYLLYSEQPEGSIFQAQDAGEFSFDYSLSEPSQTIYLPDQLREVSGLAWAGNDEILAIQDEDGIVFSYDIKKRDIIKKTKFGKPLDYEGIAKTEDNVYVLEMDGDIFEIDTLSGPEVESNKYETELNYKQNAEGICYDPKDNRLLIALKDHREEGNPEQGEGYRRLIYAFDVQDRTLSTNPVLWIDELELGRMIYQKEKSYEFKPSGIAVHPQNGYIYVVAAVGRLLLVMDRNSRILYAERLDASLFPQPEGIAFADDGRLFLSSEGRGGRGRLMIYNPKQ